MFIQLVLRAGAESGDCGWPQSSALEVARKLGASHLVNAQEQDTITAVRELTQGFGADVVIECAGTKQTWETSVDVVRRGGRVLWFGGLPGGTKVEIDAARVHYGEIASAQYAWWDS